MSVMLVNVGAEVIGYSSCSKDEIRLFDLCGIKNQITHIKGDVRDLEHLLSENPEPLAVDLQERVIDMMMIWASPITPAWCVENVAGIESELTAMGILEDLIRSSHLMEIDKGVYALAPTARS